MSWLPEDEINEVDAVSGSCMFITRACYEKTGGFDEELFAYQEDSDLCIRARQDGFKGLLCAHHENYPLRRGRWFKNPKSQHHCTVAPLVCLLLSQTLC